MYLICVIVYVLDSLLLNAGNACLFFASSSYLHREISPDNLPDLCIFYVIILSLNKSNRMLFIWYDSFKAGRKSSAKIQTL